MRTLNRSYSVTADLEIPDRGAEGVLLSYGGKRQALIAVLAGRQAALRVRLCGGHQDHLESKRTCRQAYELRRQASRCAQGPRGSRPRAALHRWRTCDQNWPRLNQITLLGSRNRILSRYRLPILPRFDLHTVQQFSCRARVLFHFPVFPRCEDA